ncbi:MAG: glycosyltransferase [Methylococcales bacterium]
MNKKILFNTWQGAFFNEGGGEVQLRKSREYLEKLGCQVDLYDMWAPQKEFDILHQFSIQYGVNFVVESYKTLGYKIALSTIMWDLPGQDDPYYYHIKNLFNHSDILLTNSDLESKKLADAFGIEISKFHKTRNSIADEYRNTDTNEDFQKKFNISGDFVLSVANIDTRKNTHNLIQACAELDLNLVSVGHIRDNQYYDSFKDQYSNFQHVGNVDDIALLKSAYQQCKLFALPSLCETPGIAALEAASQGTKIVITSEGAAPEYFGSKVTYVNPYELEDITEGLRSELHLNRDASLRKHVIDCFTWDKTALDIVDGYNKIICVS